MKAMVTLDGAGYEQKEADKAKGFELAFGEYGGEVRFTVKMDFADGLALLTQLVTKAREHQTAVQARLNESGRLALLADALAVADSA